MSCFLILIKRNVKLFFKDKGMFFTALITPAILLILYSTFLADVYRNSFITAMPEGISLSSDVLDALVGGQLVSSILAVSCVTVAFSSNFLMVQDKANGRIKDLMISPVKPWILSATYYAATLISTLIICISATVLCLLYLAAAGWFLSFLDVVLIFSDVLLLVLFGVALSSVISYFLSTHGQISAVGSIISSGYGFICGAYMPISSFGSWLQNAIMFLPGTYATSLLRRHSLAGVFSEMKTQGIPDEATDSLYNLLDCNLYFFDRAVSEPIMYVILGSSIALLIGIYVVLNTLRKTKK